MENLIYAILILFAIILEKGIAKQSKTDEKVTSKDRFIFLIKSWKGFSMIAPDSNDNQNVLVSYIGFWASLLSAIFYITFDAAAIAAMTGLLDSKYWTFILEFTPSLFLALSFLILMVCIHYSAPVHLKVLSHIAIVIAGIYAALNCFIYICQVLVIAPNILAGSADTVALFEMAPGRPLYAVNALAYSLMGLSTLFAAFTFKGKGLAKWVRNSLLLHGVVFPTIVGVLIWPPLFYISATVGLTYPLSAILIAIFFRKKVKEKAEI